MKIKHAIIVTPEEVDALFNVAYDAAVATYATTEEMTLALAKAKIDFETLLNRYTQISFKMGKKIGKAKANEKDTKMYAAGI